MDTWNMTAVLATLGTTRPDGTLVPWDEEWSTDTWDATRAKPTVWWDDRSNPPHWVDLEPCGGSGRIASEARRKRGIYTDKGWRVFCPYCGSSADLAPLGERSKSDPDAYVHRYARHSVAVLDEAGYVRVPSLTL